MVVPFFVLTFYVYMLDRRDNPFDNVTTQSSSMVGLSASKL